MKLIRTKMLQQYNRHGFFTPENIKMLKDLWKDDQKTPRPLLDEINIEEMEYLLFESLNANILIEITNGKTFFYVTRWICKENRFFK